MQRQTQVAGVWYILAITLGLALLLTAGRLVARAAKPGRRVAAAPAGAAGGADCVAEVVALAGSGGKQGLQAAGSAANARQAAELLPGAAGGTAADEVTPLHRFAAATSDAGGAEE